jgi:colanic acid/amylovoran biosynthesis glycosyltransferase
MTAISATRGIALQRCDRFVARTMNWLYDHLRFVPHYTPYVLCDALQNRDEFPEITASCVDRTSFMRRAWQRVAGDWFYPTEWRRLRRLKPRLLHSHFGYVAVEDYSLHQTLEIPWVVGFYGADVYVSGRLPEWRAMYAQVFERVARVLVLVPVMSDHLQRLGCPPEKIRVHPLGVDVQNLPSRLRRLEQGQNLKVLFAGTFREKKGIHYLLDAAAMAKRAGIRFELRLIADVMGKPGDDETKQAVFRQIRQLCLEDIVMCRPFLRFQELLNLALDSHVFVAPSITASDGDAEGTPFVLQQMIATGMPAISTFHSDIPFLFGEHAHLLVPECDARAIADRLQSYFANPETLTEHGATLQDRIRRQFDVRKCAAALSAVYNSVQ